METASGPTGLITIFREFFIIGATSFGGGTVAYERSLLTEKRKWCSDDAFNAMLAISQTLPGLNAVNLAILAGDHVRGPGGALAAVSGLLLPGAVFVLAEEVGFEPTNELPRCRFSRPVLSTAQPLLRGAEC